ncbi:hypothetical protein BDV28DRAFT_128386 [Aspergillus coremiiformis]|uniref:Uncharacterized protein n=1 Tax=Aspergillus coremiiformis TaxID=138285 RepID=A0A5N6ZDR1_9EURO|nr:hypothetical protein BDV28DRAFT_128386 [Aspergillus coremiiformis]
MDYRPDRLFTHPDEFRPSSSFSRQRWSQWSLAHSHPVVETAGSVQQATSCRYESALDESPWTYRTTALRHLSGSNPRPPSWSHRPSSQTGGRPSTSPSQPVLVRAYSNGRDNRAGPSKMSLRRSFPFTGCTESPTRGAELPSDEDFSIDGILRAIEPNIRHTLDSIGEICGRSKLSLANEYGSHIAPLGEIRAPPGGLMPVDEASSEHERQATDNVVIYDDDPSLMDGRDNSSLTHSGLMENFRHSTTSRNAGVSSILPFSGGDGSSVQVQPDTPRSMGFSTTVDAVSVVAPFPTTRETASRPKSCGPALLAKHVESSSESERRRIQTPALVSEVHLDAQAERHHAQPESYITQPQSTMGNDLKTDMAQGRWAFPTSGKFVLADVFGWIKYPARDGSNFGQAQQTAEMRLRAMLERQENLDASSADTNND